MSARKNTQNYKVISWPWEGGFLTVLAILLCLFDPVPGRAQAPLPGEEVVLSVKIESLDPARSLGSVVGVLSANGLLPTEKVTIAPGEVVSEILKNRFQLPGVGKPLEQAVARLNPEIPDLNRVKAGDTLVLPQPPRPYESRQIFWKDSPQDATRFELRTKNWGAVRLEPPTTSKDEPFLRETYRGYEYRLVTSDVDAAQQAANALWGISSELGLRVALTPAQQEAVVPRYTSSMAPKKYWNDCTFGSGVGTDSEANYAALLPRLQEWDVGEALRSCRRSATAPRPTVILIDRPVYPHTELGGVRHEQHDGVEMTVAAGVQHEGADGARWSVEQVLEELGSERDRLAAGALIPVSGGSEALRCATDAFKEERDHGTHLASIIASQADGRGFSGVVSGVSLRSIIDKYDLNQFNQLLEREAVAALDAPIPRVVVFAKPFPHMALEDVEHRNYAAPLLDLQGQLATPESRRAHTSAAIVREQSVDIWVVAAGQDEKTPQNQDPRPIGLTDRTPLAPQNLGDLPNVIVATTCDDCSENASLWPRANVARQTGMVTVAAPGLGIPGAIAGNAYAMPTGGTSESAAFVGGVVAAMLSCGYERYRHPEQIKRRLRLTGRPDLRDVSTEKLSDVVVVDPRAALLDPTQDWLLKHNSDQPGVYKTAVVMDWCDDLLRGKVNDEPVNLDISTIRRLVRLQPDEDVWAVFHVAGSGTSEQGSIKVVGPFKFLGDDDTHLLRVRRSESSVDGLPRSRIDDLILAGKKGALSCPAVVAAGPG